MLRRAVAKQRLLQRTSTPAGRAGALSLRLRRPAAGKLDGRSTARDSDTDRALDVVDDCNSGAEEQVPVARTARPRLRRRAATSATAPCDVRCDAAARQPKPPCIVTGPWSCSVTISRWHAMSRCRSSCKASTLLCVSMRVTVRLLPMQRGGAAAPQSSAVHGQCDRARCTLFSECSGACLRMCFTARVAPKRRSLAGQMADSCIQTLTYAPACAVAIHNRPLGALLPRAVQTWCGSRRRRRTPWRGRWRAPCPPPARRS